MYYNRFSSPKKFGSDSKNILEFVGSEVVLYRLTRKEKGGYKRREIKRLPVSALFKELKETLYDEKLIETPLLPEGTRCLSYRKETGDGVLVLEQAPQTRTITWTDRNQTECRGKIKKLELAFPFVVLVCKISSDLINEVRIFYRTSLISSLQDELLHTNLRNTFTDNCKICLGFIGGGRVFNAEILSPRFRGNLVEQVEQIFSKLWENCFNADIDTDEFTETRGVDKRIATVEAWQRASQEDELFPLSVRWRKTGKTVADMIKEVGSGYSGQDDPLCSLDDLLDIFYRCAPKTKPKHLPVAGPAEEEIRDREMTEMEMYQGGEDFPYA